VERGFDWAALRAAGNAMSLFAERRILEVRLNGASPGEAGGAVLVEMAERPPPDTLLLVITGKLDAKAQTSRWVSAIEKHGLFLPVWPIETARLPAWIRDRLTRAGLQADAEAAAVIAERVEGNLLAAHQEIEKLALLHPQGKLDGAAIMDTVADSARYDVLQLGEAAMRGQALRALKILGGLQEEGVDATLILWAVNKDLQWLGRVQHLMRQGQSADSAMGAAYVWRPRQAAMKQAIVRIKPAQLKGLLIDAGRVDRAIKGALALDPWLEMEALVARFCGVKLARTKVA
jgi:DNA polymerase-3 subunit delta